MELCQGKLHHELQKSTRIGSGYNFTTKIAKGMNIRISNTLFDLASLVGHTLNGLGRGGGVARRVDITDKI